ncbi:Uncharacterised protein [Mycobacteroides abscessus subsp. abscessus]|nr:Uncharacterised protein [Mycobacteroides abscessus subsp. abscessus]
MVRSEPIPQVRAVGHDPGGIDVAVDQVVVLLDLCEVDGVAETRSLEEVARVRPQHRHLRQFAPIALEMPVIDRIESRKRREQPDVCLGDGVAHQVALRCQAFGQFVEFGEEPVVCLVVRVLTAGESAAVHAVVDLGVDTLADGFDLVA